ncbi:metallophosphoesterase family protein [Nakamurella leprariae]|uniref:Metallophosphoesterase n=1 Tax=Nakamurella leprariae TaxID=2803911 RepID=A0A938YBW3_9ACTN|nr:metallophosphoesterase [Nakamurella leprariae]MBM9466984.1 metallophosphoesterase [Nakamurella leprariae]
MTDDRAAVPPTPDGSAVERPTHRLIHLSDTHLTEIGVKYNGVIDADAALATAAGLVRGALDAGVTIDAVIASGDLTDTGDPDAYRRLSTALGDLGLPVIWAVGNHDVRVTLHEQLLGRSDTEPVLQVHRIGGLRIVVLDSTVPGRGDGVLAADHLAALGDELATPADDGTVVVLHHAPLPAPSPLLEYFALHRASRAALRDAVADTDVRLVLAGHHHLARSGMLRQVPVAVAGSAAIRTDPLAPRGTERTVAAGSLNLVELFADGHAVSVIPFDEALGAGQAFHLDQAGTDAVIRRHLA